MRIFLFIDALGWDIVGKTGFLQDLLPHRREMTAAARTTAEGYAWPNVIARLDEIIRQTREG